MSRVKLYKLVEEWLAEAERDWDEDMGEYKMLRSCAVELTAILAESEDPAKGLAEAREDIKALATALRTPWRSRSEAEAAWQRIRSRRLLEVSE